MIPDDFGCAELSMQKSYYPSVLGYVLDEQVCDMTLIAQRHDTIVRDRDYLSRIEARMDVVTGHGGQGPLASVRVEYGLHKSGLVFGRLI